MFTKNFPGSSLQITYQPFKDKKDMKYYNYELKCNNSTGQRTSILRENEAKLHQEGNNISLYP